MAAGSSEKIPLRLVRHGKSSDDNPRVRSKAMERGERAEEEVQVGLQEVVKVLLPHLAKRC